MSYVVNKQTLPKNLLGGDNNSDNVFFYFRLKEKEDAIGRLGEDLCRKEEEISNLKNSLEQLKTKNNVSKATPNVFADNNTSNAIEHFD